MDKIKVLVVSSQTFFRQGVWFALSKDETMDVVTTAEIAPTSQNQLLDTPLNVLIIDMDSSSADCLTMARRLKQHVPDLGIVLLGSESGDTQLVKALEIQASAYLKKESTPEELKDAVRCVARGESPIHETYTARGKVALQVLRRFQELSWRSDNETSISPLTRRELEVITWVAKGQSNKKIAYELNISEQTVKNHLTSILEKLNATARTEAVVLAIKQGLISVG